MSVYYWLWPSQSVLPMVRQSVFQGNLSISVSYHSFSKAEWCTNFVTIETEITLFNRKPYRKLFFTLLGLFTNYVSSQRGRGFGKL